METTRRYPRTAAEAFKGADYASAITCYGKRSIPGMRAVFFLLVVLFLIGAASR